jgi:hypothetical protein
MSNVKAQSLNQFQNPKVIEFWHLVICHLFDI